MNNKYIYFGLVDGLVRYVGRGENSRVYRQAQIVTLLVAGEEPRGVLPGHYKFAEATKLGCEVEWQKIEIGLTLDQAIKREREIIEKFEALAPGQLWNVEMTPRRLAMNNGKKGKPNVGLRNYWARKREAENRKAATLLALNMLAPPKTKTAVMNGITAEVAALVGSSFQR